MNGPARRAPPGPRPTSHLEVVDVAKPTYARRHLAPPAARRAIDALQAENRGEITAEQRRAILDEIAEQLNDELELPFDQEGGDE